MGFIYKLTSPSGKSYIGQTIRPIKERFEEHQYQNSYCVAICNAIQKYGWDNIDKDWYECPDEDLNFDEELLAREMGTLAPGGYNLREGGGATGKMSEGTKQKMSNARLGDKNPMFGNGHLLSGERNGMYGKTHTIEVKKIIREANVGKILSEEHKQKVREAQIGKTHTEESKQKMSKSKRGDKHPMHGKTHTKEAKKKIRTANRGEKNGMFGNGHLMSGEKNHFYGKTHTDETKKKNREAHTGKTHSEESKQKMSKANQGENNTTSKKVYQYTIDGNFIWSFASCGEAARHLKKKDGSAISRCARGKLDIAYGFKWSYTEL